MRMYPSRAMIVQSWEKYGLIVVGNIVFFALLYFISYRPNNDENRAAEFLSMAQEQEAIGRAEAAMVLFDKVIATYPDTRAAGTAKGRLSGVKKLLASPPRVEPEMVQPRLDLQTMLDRRPTVYLATFLAKHYNDDPTQTSKIHEAIENYLWVAANHEGIDFRRLQKEKEFSSDFFQREFFSIRPRCTMTPDWLYDDFLVKNSNFFAWHNVNIKLVVSQGGSEESHEIRVPFLGPGESVDMLEFWVSSGEGVITCKGELTAQEGATTWSQQI